VPQDAFEQGLERELAGEVRGEGGERLEARGVVVGAWIGEFRMNHGRRSSSMVGGVFTPTSHHALEARTAPAWAPRPPSPELGPQGEARRALEGGD